MPAPRGTKSIIGLRHPQRADCGWRAPTRPQDQHSQHARDLFLTLVAACAFAWSGARKEEELASVHVSMLEGAALSMQQLRTDLREMW